MYLGVVAVGKEMARTEKFFLLATRVLAENGANVVKSYYCEGFEADKGLHRHAVGVHLNGAVDVAGDAAAVGHGRTGPMW